MKSGSIFKSRKILRPLPLAFLQITLFSAIPLQIHAATPATNSDIALYQAMGTSFFCMSALEGVHFPKALGISASTYAQALKGRHQGRVMSLRGKSLSDKEMFAAAEQQILLRAMKACPKAIPDDVRRKVKTALQNQNPGKPQTETQTASNANNTSTNQAIPTISDSPFELVNPSLQELMQGTPFQWKR